MAKKKEFNPEGSDYDLEAAKSCGLKADDTGHWPSRCPDTGQILKGRKHKTWDKTLKGEHEVGYALYKKEDGKYYSKEVKKKPKYEEGK